MERPAAHTSAETPHAVERLLSGFPRRRDELLPVLLAVHAEAGWLSEAALSAVARHVRVPDSEAYGVATSYSELTFTAPEGERVGVCTGLSCLLAGAGALADVLVSSLPAGWALERQPCRFRCDRAPTVHVRGGYVDEAKPAAVMAAVMEPDTVAAGERAISPIRQGEVRRLLRRCGTVDPASIDDAIAAGAYAAWARARTMAPDAIIEDVERAGLRGRGGAYFPAATKWKATRAHPAPRYLVVNAEEGEPAVFKDRVLMELDPHLLVEGLLIAARAIEPAEVYVYVNGEAETSAARLLRAVEDARGRGFIDAGTPPIAVRRGAGGYVCGEESVILSSVEGHRAVPRLRPPFPVDAGLWGRPTVINNVETLCNLPLIVTEGADAFRGCGTPEFPGTKLVCVSGAVRAPGVYEVPFGTALRHVMEVCAGGPVPGKDMRAVLCGGPSGTLLPPGGLDVPLVPGGLDESGASPGAGGIVVIDESMSIREVVRHLTAYNARESCGKCTPCREGTARMRDVLDGPGADALERLDELAEAVGAASLCGLGQMAPLPYLSARRHFADQFLEARS
ncbi:MAG TPA: NADH-ubiquinone oxidoreductase-F iron-sulfur binding region domain-containing protein [Dehalococcoidia bacterium]|nr:NADH-ubiquinone oxidoreductase-F iron-sulfur binding region domain-containing protein [Dehalococcoidia bacterium]